MTTTTLSDLLTIEVPCTDEDGRPELITVQVVEGYVVEVLQDGDVVNSDTAAELLAGEKAKDVAAEDRRMIRERIKAARRYRKECLLGCAEEMDGFDAQAVKMLARLLASGRGESALAALRSAK